MAACLLLFVPLSVDIPGNVFLSSIAAKSSLYSLLPQFGTAQHPTSMASASAGNGGGSHVIYFRRD